MDRDDETGEESQAHTPAGVPKWTVEAAFKPEPLENGSIPDAGTEKVTIAAEEAPEVTPMTELRFVGLLANAYGVPQRGGNVKSGIWLQADEVYEA